MDEGSLAVSFYLLSAIASDPRLQDPRPVNYTPLLSNNWKFKTFRDKDGFFLNEETVKTEDNYVLTMHHLGRNDCSPNRSVLLLHGLLGASDVWLMQGPGKDLAFLLADACYDVWLGNFRGNFYSRKNTKISPKNPKFWDFSFDEIGRYDAPAMLDQIYYKTGRRQVTIVAHSMGCTVTMAMAISRPEYKQWVDAVFLLAPAVLMSPVNENHHWAFRMLNRYLILLPKIGQKIGFREFYPRRGANPYIVRKSCDPGFYQKYCLNLFGFIFGEHRSNLNLRTLGKDMVTVVSGTSARTFIHLNQLSKSNWTFRKYDYGVMKNLKVYGQLDPPEYPLDEVDIPAYLFSGENDALVINTAVKKLSQTLPNVVSYHMIEDHLFSHMDFIWGMNAKEILYKMILKQMASVQLMK